jgi:hypothetical protein
MRPLCVIDLEKKYGVSVSFYHNMAFFVKPKSNPLDFELKF